MNQTAKQPVEDFLTDAQIKRHGLKGCTAEYSLQSGSTTNKGINTPDGEKTDLYITEKGGKHVVKKY